MEGKSVKVVFTRWDDGTWMAAPEPGLPIGASHLDDLMRSVREELEKKLVPEGSGGS